MTDTTKNITLKLQKAKENAAGHEPAIQKVFLGNFVYAEFQPYKGDVRIRLTDEDGCGRARDVISIGSDQFEKLEQAYHAERKS